MSEFSVSDPRVQAAVIAAATEIAKGAYKQIGPEHVAIAAKELLRKLGERK
jgi:hypothetical protein